MAMYGVYNVMGYSRDTFYHFRELHDTGGELALQENSKKRPVVRNRIEAHIEDAVVKMATDKSAMLIVYLITVNVRNFITGFSF